MQLSHRPWLDSQGRGGESRRRRGDVGGRLPYPESQAGRRGNAGSIPQRQEKGEGDDHVHDQNEGQGRQREQRRGEVRGGGRVTEKLRKSSKTSEVCKAAHASSFSTSFPCT